MSKQLSFLDTIYIVPEFSTSGNERKIAVSWEDRDLAKLKCSVYKNGNNSYAYVWVDSESIAMHRLILERMVNRLLQKGEYVDHINSDGLDNQRLNLRLATAAQNAQNARAIKGSKSGYKGVALVYGGKKWDARITVNHENIFLGDFDSPEEAHQAYCKAADKYHGKFANYG